MVSTAMPTSICSNSVRLCDLPSNQAFSPGSVRTPAVIARSTRVV